MNPNLLYLAAALFVVVLFVELLRRRQLREKHAVLWLFVAAGVVFLGLFPDAVRWAADLVGVQTPVNLLFFLATLLLLAVALQLSWDLGRLEDETRTLSEEVALLRLRLDELPQVRPGSGGGTENQGGDSEGSSSDDHAKPEPDSELAQESQ